MRVFGKSWNQLATENGMLYPSFLTVETIETHARMHKQPCSSKCLYLKLQLLHNRLNATCNLHDAICHDVLSNRLIFKISCQQIGSRHVSARTDAMDRRVV